MGHKGVFAKSKPLCTDSKGETRLRERIDAIAFKLLFSF